MVPKEQKTSPWVYIGLGCGILVVVVVLVLGALLFVGYRKIKDLEAEVKDPVAMTARVKEILHCESLPDGYTAMVGMTIPFVFDLAILSDQRPGADGKVNGFDERGFIYLRILSFGGQRDELKAYFEGKTDDAAVLRTNRINIDPKQVIRRGVVESGGQTLMYLAQRGGVMVHSSHMAGLNTLMLADCPQDRKMSFAIWFGPDPNPDQPPEKLDLTGSPADENAIREFVGHFRMCGPS